MSEEIDRLTALLTGSLRGGSGWTSTPTFDYGAENRGPVASLDEPEEQYGSFDITSDGSHDYDDYQEDDNDYDDYDEQYAA